MHRYVVTGATGFIGSRLTDLLEDLGHEVIIAGRKPVSSRNFIDFSLDDRSSFSNIIASQPDGIFHLAWSNTPATAEASPENDIAVNVSGTAALFQTAKTMSIPVVFVSSGGTVYGNAATIPTPETDPLIPIGAYGLGKVVAEQYAQYFNSRGADIRIARVSNPFGTGQSTARLQGVVPIFTKRVLLGESLTIWGESSIKRDFVAVEDVAHALALMMSRDKTSNEDMILNIGSGVGLSLEDVIDIIEEELKQKASVVHSKPRGFDIRDSILSIKRAEEIIGWRPLIDPRQGIRHLVQTIQKSM